MYVIDIDILAVSEYYSDLSLISASILGYNSTIDIGLIP